MINSFKHKGLKKLYERGDRSGINPTHIKKVERIIANLDAAKTVNHLRMPGYRLHELRGHLKNFYAIYISGNWRIIFRFKAGQAYDIDLVDYH